MNRRILFSIALVALLAGLATALWLQRPAPIQGAHYYDQPRALPAFELTDHREHPLANEQLLGHWTLVFVGYTFCPDICPTTLADLARWYEKLPQAEQQQIQVLFVSVDPERDQPARLADYIRYFHPDFMAATAAHTQLYPLTKSMGLLYNRGQPLGEDGYTVDHSASLVLINPAGQLQAIIKPRILDGIHAGVDSQLLTADLRAIQSRWQR